MKKAIIILLTITALSIVLVLNLPFSKADASTEKIPVNKFSKKINLEKSKNLMIVAHPDDETIWGADHLLEEDYLVVCVTCGNDKVRDKEIKNALNISEDELLKLGYPDNPDGIISDWVGYKEKIINDLQMIINMKYYDKIVTHNPQGEYGHVHHKMLNRMVTKIVRENSLVDYLYYFAKYYTKEEVKSSSVAKFPIKNYNQKMNEMVKVYKSQSFIEDSFSHVMTSEEWQKYTNLIETSVTKSMN